MKNRRDVCFARDAGIIEFDGLPGSIKTGCTATPAYKSRYCEMHKNHACDLTVSNCEDEEMDEPTGPTLRYKQPKKPLGNQVAQVAQALLGKKTTRQQTYYQVAIMHTV